MSDNFEILGTGHPNKFLQRDYAERERRWYVRVETLVPIEDKKLEDVKKWLDSSDENEIKKLSDYLVSQVPSTRGTNPQKDAKHMVAAAFGREYPSSEGEETRSVADRPVRQKEGASRADAARRK